MHPLFYLLPILTAYVVFRAYRHHKAGRRKWCIQYLFVAGFFVCVFLFEVWMQW
ncbi:MAG: hypothetical protein AAGA29_08490 [Planctomycetota bacterium]